MNSYCFRDPLVFWGIGTAVTTRSSESPLPDPFGILKQATVHGLLFGAVSSYGPVTSLSIVGVSCADRELSDDELLALSDNTARLHIEAKPPSEPTKAQIEASQCFANGDRHIVAAAKLGISESAFKARLTSARVRLGARMTSEASRKAQEHRLL